MKPLVIKTRPFTPILHACSDACDWLPHPVRFCAFLFILHSFVLLECPLLPVLTLDMRTATPCTAYSLMAACWQLSALGTLPFLNAIPNLLYSAFFVCRSSASLRFIANFCWRCAACRLDCPSRLEAATPACTLSTGRLQAVYRPPPGHLQAVYRASTGHLQAVYRPSTGRLQAVYRPSTGRLQAVYRPSTGRLQAVYRPSPGWSSCCMRYLITG